MYVVGKQRITECYRKYTLAAMLSAGIALSVQRLPVRARFFAPVQTGLGANPAFDIMGTGSPEGKAAKVKERVQLYV
jgi:hypothetical protein